MLNVGGALLTEHVEGRVRRQFSGARSPVRDRSQFLVQPVRMAAEGGDLRKVFVARADNCHTQCPPASPWNNEWLRASRSAGILMPRRP